MEGEDEIFFASKKDMDYIASLKETLSLEGSCLLPEHNLFLAVDQWKTLNYTADTLEYKKISKKGAKDTGSFKSSKIKLPKTKKINNKVIFDVINSIQMINFVRALTEINHFSVDRCESHLFEEGDFIPIEWAKKNFEGSKYTVYLFLHGSYTGGQHVVYKPGRGENVYSPKPGEILISSCDCFHEVKPVTSGNRKLILACVQPLISISPDRAS